jgi:hypothetical protein
MSLRGQHANQRERGRSFFTLLPLLLMLLLIVGLFILGAVLNHLSAVDVIHLLVDFGVLVLVGIGQFLAATRSARRPAPRPRWHYVLFVLAYLAVGVPSAVIGAWGLSNHKLWLGATMLWPTGYCIVGIVVAFGRGVFHGRVRRSFWRTPPSWLEDSPQK